MDDLISRQAAIDAIEEYSDRLQMVNWQENPGVPYKAYALNWAVNTIRDLPSAHPEQRWIPCSERLPESGVPVLISHVGFVTEDFLDIDELLGGAYFWNSGISLDEELKNIAWMPLPAPWKGEADGHN